MNKRFLLAAVFLGLGSAAIQAPTATPAPAKAACATEQGDVAVSHQVTPRKSAPAKPASQTASPRQVAYQPRGIFGQVRFIEKPHLRKVKYGKRRWVMV